MAKSKKPYKPLSAAQVRRERNARDKETEEEKRKEGRPTLYTEELAKAICKEIATSSKSLRSICKMDGMPCVATVMNWQDDYPEFLVRYTKAKQEQADYMVDEMIDIADDGTNDYAYVNGKRVEDKEFTSRSRLRLETRKWIAAKLKPKKYGDKLDVTTDGEKIQTTVIKWGDKDIQV